LKLVAKGPQQGRLPDRSAMSRPARPLSATPDHVDLGID
jgi:hypothetical protein